MDADKALAELKTISAQIEEAVVFTSEGEAVASTITAEENASRVVSAGAKLLSEADALRAEDAPPVTQLQAATEDGCVFVVREGETAVVATTGPDPVIGLVMYDLRTCLRALADEPAKPARRRRAESK
jgi:predicted regulator of Ras-like GTPase activity (Roadblock/LC7/MglB family)